MMLNRLIYVSESQIDPAEGKPLVQLASIIKASVRNNQAANITGALAFDGTWFLQVLEGDRDAIWKTFQRISEDERHDTCLLIEMRAVEDRMFGNWWMGVATYDAATAPAFRPYLRKGILYPREMTANDILNMMFNLSQRGLRREMREAA